MKHVIWKDQEAEEDFKVHFLKATNSEFTLCGLAYEGGVSNCNDQNFIPTKEKVDCEDCIDLVEMCKSVKSNEYFKL